MSINPVQDGPRLGNLGPDGLNLGSTIEDTDFNFTEADLLAGYTDPDGTPLQVKAGSVTDYGVITIDGTNYTYSPNLNFNGPTQINFTVIDDFGDEVATSKFFEVISVNDAPLITLDRPAADEDLKPKTYIVPLDDIFGVIPDTPVVQLLAPNNAITTNIVGASLQVDISAGYSDPIEFIYGDTIANPDSQYTLDILRLNQVADRNVVTGFERFFNLSDFPVFSDIEGLPLQSVLIQIPDSSLGSIRIGSGNFSTDTNGVDQLTTVASADFNQTNVYEVTREQIITGSVFFVTNPSPLNAGKSVDLEFFVKDESGDLSDIPGLIRIGILEAPLSVQESIEESKYEPIFDAALGSDRFASIDVIISSIGVTRGGSFGDSLFRTAAYYCQ